MKAAADLLVEQSMECGVDASVHSAMFLYRHYLEIGMKDLIVSLRGYYGEPYSPPKGHDLMHLWGEARALMEREWNAPQSCRTEMQFRPALVSSIGLIVVRRRSGISWAGTASPACKGLPTTNRLSHR